MRSRMLFTLAIMLSGLIVAVPPAVTCTGDPHAGTTVVSPPQTQLYLEGTYPVGLNLIEIPAFSPVNKMPNNPQHNGFQQLCDIFGLRGSPSSISQINPTNGNFVTFICNQAAAPPFMPCQGVLIEPDNVPTPILGRIPVGDTPDGSGVEGSWTYQTYAGKKAFFGVPLTIASTSPEVLCQQLGLAPGTQVSQFLADVGTIKTHNCGQIPQFSLRPGEALYIVGSQSSSGQVTIN
jgi:hypothetical protein